jgi:hypothetical protein
MSAIDLNDRIDWNTELRTIEREFDGLPPEPSPAELKAQLQAERTARARSEERLAVVGANARVLLVAGLLAALYWWPYPNDCGVGLTAFLGAECMIVVGGLWSAVASWRSRLGATHGVAVTLLVTGMALVAAQMLSRLGYVNIVGLHATHFRCG